MLCGDGPGYETGVGAPEILAGLMEVPMAMVACGGGERGFTGDVKTGVKCRPDT